MDNMLEGYNVPLTIKRYLRDGASGVEEAWKKDPNCQQCSRKLSPAERKQSARVCAKCVKKNKGAVWGKDSDDDESVSEAYLTEFGNRPYPWRMTVNNVRQLMQAQFTIPETEMVYKVAMWVTKGAPVRPAGSISRGPGTLPPAPPEQWEFGFGRHTTATAAWDNPSKGIDTIIGKTGVEIPVFATVVAIFKAFVKAAHPKSIVYSAKDPSRKRLYSRFTKMVQRAVPGYKGTEPRPGQYEIVKEDTSLSHKDTHMTIPSGIPSFKSFVESLVAKKDNTPESVAVQAAAPGSLVSEVTPPGMEDWVTKNKARFHKEYGDRGNEILYSTAWDMYEKGKRD